MGGGGICEMPSSALVGQVFFFPGTLVFVLLGLTIGSI